MRFEEISGEFSERMFKEMPITPPSLRGAKRRSNPEPRERPGLLRRKSCSQ
jgi:hypothetical protein